MTSDTRLLGSVCIDDMCHEKTGDRSLLEGCCAYGYGVLQRRKLSATFRAQNVIVDAYRMMDNFNHCENVVTVVDRTSQ